MPRSDKGKKRHCYPKTLDDSFYAYRDINDPKGPDHKVKCYSSENEYTPSNMCMKSSECCLFNCDECGHQFQCRLSGIVDGSWCPYCCIPCQKICGTKECLVCLPKTMINLKDIYKFWSTKNTKQPYEVMIHSRQLIYVICQNKICYHEYEISACHYKNNSKCAYCTGKKVCGEKECQKCLPKTMASIININKIWSLKNTKQPHEVMLGLHTYKVFLICQNIECNHEYDITPGHFNNGSQCPYCTCNSNRFCEQNEESIECKICYNKSFASHPISKYWNYELNVNRTPYNTTKFSNKKFAFNCPHCKNTYWASPSNIVNSGS